MGLGKGVDCAESRGCRPRFGEFILAFVEFEYFEGSVGYQMRVSHKAQSVSSNDPPSITSCFASCLD